MAGIQLKFKEGRNSVSVMSGYWFSKLPGSTALRMRANPEKNSMHHFKIYCELTVALKDQLTLKDQWTMWCVCRFLQ